MPKTLITVGGPTAAGKTEFCIRLARHFGTEIISADSRQFYRETEIGTAKPSAEELAAVPHHFINSLSIHDPYSVRQYEQEALALIDKLFEKHDTLIMTGGSGLFISAVCRGIDEMPTPAPGVREKLNEEFENQGLAPFVEELKAGDPVYAAEADLANPRRVLRALEIIRSCGKPFSSFRKKEPAKRPFRSIQTALSPPRELLYERINRRADLMLAAGWEAEARKLHPFRNLSALQTVGYTELFDYFEEKHDFAETVRLIKRNTRRYAKRQTTWFRKEAEAFFEPQDWDGFMHFLSENLKNQ